jgi:FeS assembly protein IscX
MAEPLNWESIYAIALALKEAHPKVDMQNISLQMIFNWTIALPAFDDDPALANDDILAAIYQDWFEETL